MAKCQKIGNVFNPHKSFPGRQQNVASRKRVSYRKTKHPFELEICRFLGAVIPHGSRNSEEAIVSEFEFWWHHLKTQNTLRRKGDHFPPSMHNWYIPEADICTYSSRKHHPKGEAFHKIASPIKEHLPQTRICPFLGCLQFFLSEINYPLNRLVSKKIFACKENFGHNSRLEKNSCPNQINQPPPPLKRWASNRCFSTHRLLQGFFNLRVWL